MLRRSPAGCVDGGVDMERSLVRILLVEDCPDDAMLVRRKLERETGEPGRFRLEHCATLQAALDRLGKREADVLLLDLHLPDSDGIETVVRVRELDASVPIVVFTVAGDERTAMGALRAGAQDYLVKDELGLGPALPRAIHYAIERKRIGDEKRQLQERLLRAEKLESLGVLAAGAAFAFNTLVGEILEQVDESLARPEDARGMGERLRAVRHRALRAAEMAQQLRDYATGKHAETVPLDLPRLVLDASGMIEAIAGRGIEVHYELADPPPRVRANAGELRQLLLNLVVNAVEAIAEDGGAISIATGTTRADRELLAETQGASDPREGVYAFVRVRDSGVGLPEQACEQLFDPFFSTKYAGRGLGLSAAFGIARQHGGVIRARPANPGTEFTVLLPPTP
jgi:signal transduction histidine kinase